MQKKKILFAIHQLNYGGVQREAISALNAIDYSQNEVTLYVRKNRTQLLSKVNKNVNQIIINQDKTHYYRKPYIICLIFCKKIAKLFRKVSVEEKLEIKIIKSINDMQMSYEKKHYFNQQEEYDVAISYSSGYTAKFVAEYISAKEKIMFFHTSTDENHELHESILHQFDTVVGVNSCVQILLKKFYPKFKGKITYIENFLDTNEIRENAKSYEIPSCKRELILSTCGRLTEEKGFNLAVESARILKEQGLSFFWYFIGDGPERVVLENLINKYGLEDNIQITGMKDNPYPYIDVCDIYIQPSYHESHSLTIMEAIRLYKPVITTSTVGGKFLIKEKVNGLIVDTNERSLVEGIMLMKNDLKLFNDIKEYLKTVDYSNEYSEYKKSWKKLLEESENEI